MIRSIRGRFLVVAIISVGLAMPLSGFAFVTLFTRNLERRIDEELSLHIDNIAGAITIGLDGRLALLARPTDIRFGEAYGGLYWQVEDGGNNTTLRSPSLWDYALPLPARIRASGEINRYQLPGPDGTTVLVRERDIVIAAPDGPHTIRIAVGMDAAVLHDARRAFAWDLAPYLLALAAFLIAASLAQLTFGLKPVSSVSKGLNRVRERRAMRLEGKFPRELDDVVIAVNRLLDAQDSAIEKARTRAADLAHGLKSPLTVLANDAETLKERGETDIAKELAHLATVMRAHVDRELTRSRIAASPELRSADADLGASVASIVRTLKRTPRGSELDWRIDLPESFPVAVDPHDLTELLGNLIDNAAKWAKTTVCITFVTGVDGPVMTIEDDGPGADEKDLARMTERGVRLDMQTPGTGLGLSIASDIAAVYELDLGFANRAESGLSVTIRF